MNLKQRTKKAMEARLRRRRQAMPFTGNVVSLDAVRMTNTNSIGDRRSAGMSRRSKTRQQIAALKQKQREKAEQAMAASMAERTPQELAVLGAIRRVSQAWRRLSVWQITRVMDDAECAVFPAGADGLRIAVHEVIGTLQRKKVLRTRVCIRCGEQVLVVLRPRRRDRVAGDVQDLKALNDAVEEDMAAGLWRDAHTMSVKLDDASGCWRVVGDKGIVLRDGFATADEAMRWAQGDSVVTAIASDLDDETLEHAARSAWEQCGSGEYDAG